MSDDVSLVPQAEPRGNRPPGAEWMTLREAQQWKRQVAQAARDLRHLLWEGSERHAWSALGYQNWTECLKGLAAEFDFSQRHLWHLHAANQIEAQLNHGSVGAIPERQLRPLSKVPPEERPAVWQQVQEAAPDGRVTAALVNTVVGLHQPPQEPRQTVVGAEQTRAVGRHQLYRLIDGLSGPDQDQICVHMWAWVRQSQAHDPIIAQRLEHIRAHFFPDLEFPEGEDLEDVTEATLVGGEDQALATRAGVVVDVDPGERVEVNLYEDFGRVAHAYLQVIESPDFLQLGPERQYEEKFRLWHQIANKGKQP